MALEAAAPLRSVGSGECGGAGAAPAGRARGGPGPAPPPTRWRPLPAVLPSGLRRHGGPGAAGASPAGPAWGTRRAPGPAAGRDLPAALRLGGSFHSPQGNGARLVSPQAALSPGPF